MLIQTLILQWFLPLTHDRPGHMRRGPTRLGLAGSLLLLLPLALAACNDTPPPSTDTPLNQLHWCNKPTMLFQDESQSPPVAVSDWKTVKASLSFAIYLPPTLPNGSCLVAGHAIIRDKVLGSAFGVTYQLPKGVPLAFSENAVNGSEVPELQCSADSSSKGTLLCLGTKGSTSIVLDSHASQKDLQTLFKSFKPDVDWIPQK